MHLTSNTLNPVYTLISSVSALKGPVPFGSIPVVSALKHVEQVSLVENRNLGGTPLNPLRFDQYYLDCSDRTEKHFHSGKIGSSPTFSYW